MTEKKVYLVDFRSPQTEQDCHSTLDAESRKTEKKIDSRFRGNDRKEG